MNLRVIALSNSRKMIFDEDGIDLKAWQSSIDKGEDADQELFKKVKDLTVTVFYITANESVSKTYEHFKTKCCVT
jgi:aspartokinase/homoserine dehydrogenase 1